MALRASSYIRVTTALIVGLRASIRAIVSSSTSVAVTSRRRTSSARPMPS